MKTEFEDVKKTQFLEMKNTMFKVKNTLDSICTTEFKVHFW